MSRTIRKRRPVWWYDHLYNCKKFVSSYVENEAHWDNISKYPPLYSPEERAAKAEKDWRVMHSDNYRKDVSNRAYKEASKLQHRAAQKQTLHRCLREETEDMCFDRSCDLLLKRLMWQYY